MNYRKKLSYTGIACSGESKVLPPSFAGIKALVMRAGGNEDVVAASFPPLDFVDDQEHSLVAEFVDELQNCDKIERVDLVRQFDEYVKDLRNFSEKHPEKQPEKQPDKQSEKQPDKQSDPVPDPEPEQK